MNHLDNWEDNLRHRLSDFRTPPPAMGWEKLEKALNELPVAPPVPSSKPRPFYLRPWFVSTAVSAAACLTVALLLQPSEPLTQHAAQQVASVVKQHEAPKPTHRPTVAQKVAAPAAASAPTLAHSAKQAAPEAAMPATCRMMPQPADETADQPVAVARLLHSETADTTAQTAADAPQTDAPAPYSQDRQTRSSHLNRTHSGHAVFRRAHPMPSLKRNTNHTPLLAVNALVHPANRMSMNGYMAKSLDYSYSNSPNGSGNNDWDLVVAENMDREVNTRINHHVPFQFGLNIAIPITQKWFVSTGLTYTRLTTDITSGSDASYFVTEQRLHYVGIPIQAGYTIFSSRPFNAYATAGFQIEKCVSGTQSTTYSIDQSYRSSSAYHNKLGRGLWQASFNASAGLQFNVTRNIGLYFEPGVSYYVSDGSSLPSIRHDKPWQFSMQGGLRFSFSAKP